MASPPDTAVPARPVMFLLAVAMLAITFMLAGYLVGSAQLGESRALHGQCMTLLDQSEVIIRHLAPELYEQVEAEHAAQVPLL